MLVFAAIVPHSPVLIPNIGKENVNLFPRTLEAFKTLKNRLAEVAPDVLVVLTSHGEGEKDKFVLPSAAEYEVSFEEFGDLLTNIQMPAQTNLGNRLRENLKEEANLKIVEQKKMDFGAGVPLFYLNDEKKYPVLVIRQAGLGRQEHWELGKLLAEEFSVMEERVAVIVSGELSHCLNEQAPGGYVESAKTFDKKVVETLTQEKAIEILTIGSEEALAVKECGLKVMAILMGILDGSRYEPEFLAYESPLGVGCLTMNFKLNH